MHNYLLSEIKVEKDLKKKKIGQNSCFAFSLYHCQQCPLVVNQVGTQEWGWGWGERMKCN